MSIANTKYFFTSAWQLDASLPTVWLTMTSQPFNWEEWWPQLHNVRNIRTDKRLQGTSFDCTWHAPLGYRLHCSIVIREVDKQRQVTLDVDGDLLGTVVCRLSSEGSATRVDINWKVQTTKPWMNYAALVLRPAFVIGHHAVMRSGEHGLQRYLRQQSKKSGD